jgi:hypothetical protein
LVESLRIADQALIMLILVLPVVNIKVSLTSLALLGSLGLLLIFVFVIELIFTLLDDQDFSILDGEPFVMFLN